MSNHATSAPLQPTSVDELAAMVRAASAQGEPLAVTGGGSKRGLGNPVQAAKDLSIAQLTGIVFYEPRELVIRARAGTPIAEIDALLAQEGQQLAFEIPDYRRLYDTLDSQPTLGGAVAANLAGPRRIAIGSARDHLLGVKAVNGSGEVINAGGRVMKNVTGYDLCKLAAGSHGTLMLLGEVTLKVLPASAAERTLIWWGVAEQSAVELLAAALGTPFEVSGAAHLPAEVAHHLSAVTAEGAATLVRIEGFEESMAYRAPRLIEQLARYGDAAMVEDEASRALWRELRDLQPLLVDAGEGAGPVWRLSTTPSHAPKLVAALRQQLEEPIAALYDWGGGLVWLRLASERESAQAEAIRALMGEYGGHATLMRASQGVRAAVEVFQPQAPVIAHLNRQIKAAFDPQGVLNPGLMFS